MSPLVSELLAKRGIVDTETFLNPQWERDIHDPFLLTDMDRAVGRILAALRGNEKIAIYADYDCDGVPGAALLSDFFGKIGYKNIEVYIPHRDREGYGMHESALKTLSESGVSLIITVDVGTVAVEPIAYANTLGMEVIVTDHHDLQEILPNCVAVINPKRASYPFPHLCGAGTAYKLVQALFIEGRKQAIPEFLAVPLGWEKWLLDLVAIATVADMVSLIGENRALVYFGLMVLRKSPRKGLRALLLALNIRQSELTEDDIGFSIAPRVNAASRMGEPETAFRLLTTQGATEAEHLARHLEELNTKRKSTVAAMVKEAKKRLKQRYALADKVVVLGDTEWKPALAGLAATSLLSGRAGVVCVWGKDGNGVLKGSCRTDGSVSVVELFARARDSLIEYGGHAASGGFSVSHDAVHALPDVLARAFCEIQSTPRPIPEPDLSVSIREIGMALWRDIARLAPFGVGNPKPLLRVSRTVVRAVKLFGKEKNHTEVQCACDESGARVRAFQFFKQPSDFTVVPEEGEVLSVVATLEKDTFRGSSAVALRLVDIAHARS